jgi:hypothetical protein
MRLIGVTLRVVLLRLEGENDLSDAVGANVD